MRSLRVVLPSDGGDGEPVTMAEALADLLKRAAAESPIIAVLLYEDRAGVVRVIPVPTSLNVAKVLVAEAYDQLHPERETAE
jgi:hypothetical protein